MPFFFNLALSAPPGIFFLLSIYSILLILPVISALSLINGFGVSPWQRPGTRACVEEERERARSDNRKRHILMLNSNLVLLD